jgi:signal transduction histidine kinase
MFRALQEALTNVIRHSRADQVHLELTADDRLVTLTVRDDGVGFEPERVPRTGFGLHGMRERIASYEGELELVSEPGKGTSVRISLPRHEPKVG